MLFFKKLADGIFFLFLDDLHNASKACKMVHPAEGALNEEVVCVQMEHLALIEALIQMNPLVLAIRWTRERGMDFLKMMMQSSETCTTSLRLKEGKQFSPLNKL